MNSGLYAAPGLSATVWPAVTASRFAAPTTKLSNEYLGLSALVMPRSPPPAS